MARRSRLDKIIDKMLVWAERTTNEHRRAEILVQVAELQKFIEENKQAKRAAKAVETPNRFGGL